MRGVGKGSGRRASNNRRGVAGNSGVRKPATIPELFDAFAKWRKKDKVELNSRLQRLEEKVERGTEKCEEERQRSSWADVYEYGNNGGSQRQADEGFFERRENLGGEGTGTVVNNNYAGGCGSGLQEGPWIAGSIGMKGCAVVNGQHEMLRGDGKEIPATSGVSFSGCSMVIGGLEQYTAPQKLGAGVVEQQYLQTTFGNVSERDTDNGTLLRQTYQQNTDSGASSNGLGIRIPKDIFSEPTFPLSSPGVTFNNSDNLNMISRRQHVEKMNESVTEGTKVERVAHAMNKSTIPKANGRTLGYTTTSKDGMKAHVKKRGAVEPKLKCTVPNCHKKFVNPHALKLHLISSHGYAESNLPWMLHYCKWCAKEFKYKKALCNHESLCQKPKQKRRKPQQDQQTQASKQGVSTPKEVIALDQTLDNI